MLIAAVLHDCHTPAKECTKVKLAMLLDLLEDFPLDKDDNECSSLSTEIAHSQRETHPKELHVKQEAYDCPCHSSCLQNQHTAESENRCNSLLHCMSV